MTPTRSVVAVAILLSLTFSMPSAASAPPGPADESSRDKDWLPSAAFPKTCLQQQEEEKAREPEDEVEAEDDERLRRFREDEIYVKGMLLGGDVQTRVLQIEQIKKTGPLTYAEEQMAGYRIIVVRLRGARGIAFVDGEQMRLRDAWEKFEPGQYIEIARYPDRPSTTTFAGAGGKTPGIPGMPVFPAEPPGRSSTPTPRVKYTVKTGSLSIDGEIRVKAQ